MLLHGFGTLNVEGSESTRVEFKIQGRNGMIWGASNALEAAYQQGHVSINCEEKGLVIHCSLTSAAFDGQAPITLQREPEEI